MDLKESRKIAKEIGLEAPNRYWTILLYDLQALIGEGKCGPGEQMGDWLVPDTMYFLSVQPACSIHDYMYSQAESKADQYEADNTFFRNMITLIDKQTKWRVLRWLRHRRALKYYEAVRLGGGRFID